ncbi:MAG: DmsE family decaheme c-type cytochrome [Hyphomicrobiales bacterium]|nr:DmsE family decaheme c-type cytochrome [Hyphomicrobiales bacterium]MCP5374056.1 DmsE family decaheme c-type cytochrome [Hyphomicrobiales bacterium]
MHGRHPVPWFLPFLARLSALVLLSFLAALPAAAQVAAPQGGEDLVLRGDAVCTSCHDRHDFPKVLTIGRTKHGTRADPNTPTCTSCHGESVEHRNVPREVAERPKPDIFAKSPPGLRDGACLNCHSGGKRVFWHSDTHPARGISCTACHEIHNGGHDAVLDRRTQPKVCLHCHKPEGVHLNRHEGKVICSDCHESHGSGGPAMMNRQTVNDTCFACHAEKRGPFVWSHQPVTENCTYCHAPHGSNIAGLLKVRVPFLCHECHEPGGSHRGGAPGFGIDPGATSGNNILFARGCMNCHTNIHGSNNPTNNTGSRIFTR